MARAYYNEFDPYAAQWLRNLIAAGLIPAGDVDERSIVDVQPADLAGYTQCHFFAGIGGWAYAARLAGWPDDRPLWTGSPPCQPFSVAGRGEAQADARHLWPELFRLVAARTPPVLMGEQVAAAVGKDWLDGVCADLEGIGYAVGAAVVPACSVNAPHRRDRLWFVADAIGPGQGQGELARGAEAVGAGGGDVDHADEPGSSEGRQQRGGQLGRSGRNPWARHGWVVGAGGKARRVGSDLRGVVDGLPASLAGLRAEFYAEALQEVIAYAATTERGPREALRAVRDQVASQAVWQKPRGFHGVSEAEVLLPYLCELDRRIDDCGAQSAVAEASGLLLRGVRLHTGPTRPPQGWEHREQRAGEHPDALHVLPQLLARAARQAFEAIASDAPPIRLLGHGIAARVGKLRALGNAIVPQVAAEVIAAYMDASA
jgi:DNA (cytosine-5)-methyltransferase 1